MWTLQGIELHNSEHWSVYNTMGVLFIIHIKVFYSKTQSQCFLLNTEQLVWQRFNFLE